MIQNITNYNWRTFVKREGVPVLFTSMFYRSLYPHEKVQQSLGFDIEFPLLLRTPTAYYYDAEHIDHVRQYFDALCNTDIQYVESCIRTITDCFEKSSSALASLLATLNKTDYLSSWARYNALLEPLFAFLMIKHPLGLALEDYLDSQVLANASGSQESLVDLKSHLPRHSVVAFEDKLREKSVVIQHSLRNALQGIYGIDLPKLSAHEALSVIIAGKSAHKEIQIIWDDIIDLYGKYCWKKASYWNNDLLDLTQMLQYLLALEKQPRQPRSRTPNANKLMDNERIRSAVNALSRLQVVHTLNMESIFYSHHALSPLFVSTAQFLGLSHSQLLTLTYEELTDSISARGISKHIRDVVDNRIMCYSLIMNRHKIVVSLENYEQYIQAHTISSDRLIGRSAYPGRIEGIARIILNFADLLGNIAQDEILIARVTTVDWEPFLTASAFAGMVTEEGGLTSHAAKIAREMQIPCVVGVANLLESLRTGDKIVLDATSGEVTKK